jgi:hypothetical protein
MDNRGFFEALFDFSFRSFITSKLIPVLYVLVMIGAVFYALFVLIALSQATQGGIIIGLIAAPIVFFFAVLFGRVYLEVIIVLFRIAESVAEIASQGRRNPPGM